MMQGVLHNFPDVHVKYKFACRSDVSLTPYLEEIKSEISQLESLTFTQNELDYLSKLRFIKSDFVDFLSLFKLKSKYVNAYIKDDEFHLEIEGPWLHTILFEVPILAIINEVYFKYHPSDLELSFNALKNEMNIIEDTNLKFADFGTRRRYSLSWHDYLIKVLSNHPNLVGTSNVKLAKETGLNPIGTMAHEWIEAGQAVGPRLRESQEFMLDKWVHEYRGDLGIALTDTIGIDAFLKDFDLYFAKLYDGLRHDSGSPDDFADKVIDHYKSLRIEPKTKTIVFSDGLTFHEALRLYNKYKDKINISFGIGTNFTNKMYDNESIQIVIKMVECNGQPVAKISDNPKKNMCEDKEYITHLKKVFDINNGWELH
jgi:nicotinate phosphoribosyltransferase